MSYSTPLEPPNLLITAPHLYLPFLHQETGFVACQGPLAITALIALSRVFQRRTLLVVHLNTSFQLPYYGRFRLDLSSAPDGTKLPLFDLAFPVMPEPFPPSIIFSFPVH